MAEVSSTGVTDADLNDMSGFDDAAPPEPKAPKEEAAPAEPEPAEEANGEGDEPPVDADKSEEAPKPKKTAEDRIKDVLKQRNEEREARRQLEQRLANLETRINQPQQSQQQQQPQIDAPKSPDPSAYTYGSLDDQYIQDMIEYKATTQIAQHLQALGQRQQQAQAMQTELQHLQQARTKADEIVAKGSEKYDDFNEVVWEAGMRKDYALEQPTFEALTESENAPDIIYALASDPREAARVASLSPAQQAKYVFAKDAEFSAKNKASPRAPKAPPPPGQSTRGAGGRFGVSGDTEDLDAFEKEFFAKKR